MSLDAGAVRQAQQSMLSTLSVDGVKGALGSLASGGQEAQDRVQALAVTVARFTELLDTAFGNLQRAQVALIALIARTPGDQTLQKLLAIVNQALVRVVALRAGPPGWLREATEAERSALPKVGSPLIVFGVVAGVLVIGVGGASVVAVSIAGVAWAVTYYEQAASAAKLGELMVANPAIAAELGKLGEGAKPKLPEGSRTVAVVAGITILALLGGGLFLASRSR